MRTLGDPVVLKVSSLGACDVRVRLAAAPIEGGARAPKRTCYAAAAPLALRAGAEWLRYADEGRA